MDLFNDEMLVCETLAKAMPEIISVINVGLSSTSPIWRSAGIITMCAILSVHKTYCSTSILLCC